MEAPGEAVNQALRTLGSKPGAAAAFEIVGRLARDAPRQVAPLLGQLMRAAPEGGTYFDAALTLVSEAEFGELVPGAVALLEADPGHEAASACIAYAGLQAGTSLAPHLRKLFELRINASTYYASWPWRYATELEIAFLQRIVLDPKAGVSARAFAARCLLETRVERVVRWLAEQRVQATRELPFEQVGLSIEGEAIRSLWPDTCFHLRFPDTYIAEFGDPPWRQKSLEPTWTLPCADTAVATLGGASSNKCTSCGSPLHLMLELDPVPPGLGVTSVPMLRIQTCVSCLGWEREGLQLRHGRDGEAVMLGDHAPCTPEFVAAPLRRTEVHLCPTPARWRRQDWGLSNARESLHRLGGEPSWIQSSQYPHCQECSKLMTFLMQLDTGLHCEGGRELFWGSGGIGYFFWCDPCRVSCALWQCT